MNLLEMKKKVLRLIEEVSDNETNLTDDPDIKKKINDVTNQVMFEVARMKKIPAKEKVSITADKLDTDIKELVTNLYQLENIRFKNEAGEEKEIDIFGTTVEFPEVGTATVYYFKYPERITDDTADDTYVFELSDDALEVMPYGIAADLLKSDISNNYGQIYSQRYETMLQRLDPRYSMGSVYIEGGIEI